MLNSAAVKKAPDHSNVHMSAPALQFGGIKSTDEVKLCWHDRLIIK